MSRHIEQFMAQLDKNPPVAPYETKVDKVASVQTTGLSLRDLAALVAMHALLPPTAVTTAWPKTDDKLLADRSYGIADAMLARRQRDR